MSKDNEILDRYIERVDEIQSSTSNLNAEALSQVAVEMGLSKSDLHKIEEKAVDCMERGKGYLRSHYWDDALSELHTTRSLKPFEPEVFYWLARTHSDRFHSRLSIKDKQKAEEFARECIKLDAKYHAAYEILESLSQKPILRKKKSILPAILIGGLIGLALLGALAFLIPVDRGSNEPQPVEITIPN